MNALCRLSSSAQHISSDRLAHIAESFEAVCDEVKSRFRIFPEKYVKVHLDAGKWKLFMFFVFCCF